VRSLRVVITRRARTDIRTIRDYIADRSPANAEAFILKLEREIIALGEYGAGAAPAHESDAFDFDLRQITVWPYRVLFRVHRGRIEVLHVRHGARLPATRDERGRPE
jgi:plasmid stabilization system protein ParE